MIFTQIVEEQFLEFKINKQKTPNKTYNDHTKKKKKKGKKKAQKSTFKCQHHYTIGPDDYTYKKFKRKHSAYSFS